MISLRTLAIAAAMATFCATGYAQTDVEHDTQHPDAAPSGNMHMAMGDPDAQMARMDEQMKAMQAMHDKMMMAKTPEERSALMAEHMKVMQDSMTLMGEIGPGGMMGKDGMGATGADTDTDAAGIPDVQDKDPTNGDMGVQRQMMEKRMQMMLSMMQMMIDRMPPAPDRP